MKLVAPVTLVAPVKLVAPVTVIVRGPPMDVSEVPEKYVEDTFERAPSLAPALKKCSSDTSDRELPRPVVGGGVMKMFLPSEDPLEIVTGEPPNSAAPGPPRAAVDRGLETPRRGPPSSLCGAASCRPWGDDACVAPGRRILDSG